jgi:D-alanyl-D-alanine carboxypeptidase
VPLVVALAACGGGGDGSAKPARATQTSTPTTVVTTTPTTTPTTSPPTTLADSFTSTVATVAAADLGASWHLGCPVGPDSLRMVTATFVGFDGATHTGQVVVNADVVDAVVEVFRRLYAARFPIRKMQPTVTQAEFDDFETPGDNSTGFSCRDAVTSSGAPSWSEHAYGHAIDIDPIENPYLDGSRIIPSAGAAYLDRTDVRPGMAVEGGALVNAFRSVGWGWGASFRDYQHFSTNGR